MPQAFVSYEIENDKALTNALQEASALVSDFRVPFGLISADFYKSEQAIFGLKGPGQYPPFSGPKIQDTWKTPGLPNKRTRANFGGLTAYQAYKIKKFPTFAANNGYPLLVRTGRLANSLLGPKNSGSVNIITKLSFIIGTSVPYGVYHQSDAARSKIPLRKFLFIGPEAKRFAADPLLSGRRTRWLAIIQDSVDRATRKLAEK